MIREVQKIKGADAEAQQRKLIAEYQSSGSYTAVAEKVQTKRSEQGVSQATKKTNRLFTSRGIKIQASAKRKATKLEIAEVLREMAEALEADGRGKQVAA